MSQGSSKKKGWELPFISVLVRGVSRAPHGELVPRSLRCTKVWCLTNPRGSSYGQGHCRASANCGLHEGTLPAVGGGEAEFQPTCSSSPYGPCSRAHPFFSGVISNPAPKDRPKWWVYSLFSHHPREITEATIVQITGRTTNIPAGAFQEPMEALSARINVLSLPAQRLWTSNICCGQRRPMLCVIVGS